MTPIFGLLFGLLFCLTSGRIHGPVRWKLRACRYLPGHLGRPGGTQPGQALAELLVAMLALGVLWVAAAWLGRIQDMALQASHAARHAAFLGASQAPESDRAVRASYFDGRRHRWLDRRGQTLLPLDEQAVSVRTSRLEPMEHAAQPGNDHAAGADLRHDWQVEDVGILHARVVAAPRAAPHPLVGSAWGDTVRGLDTQYPVIQRHAHILAGAGHADDDVGVRQRVAQASLPWAQAVNVSQGLSRQVEGLMQGVDKAWGRPGPEADWLGRWQAWVPGWHLDSGREQP